MSTTVAPSADRGASIVRIAASTIAHAAVALVAVMAAAAMAQAELRTAALAILAVAALVACVMIAYRTAAVLFVWVFAVSYNRQIYSFDEVFGDHGAQGLYWVPADAALVLLVGVWIFDRMFRRAAPAPAGPAAWPIFVPLLLACAAATVSAARPEWAAFELFRIAKVGFVMYVLRRVVGPVEWWSLIAAIAAVILLQAALGIVQTALGGAFGTLGTLKLSKDELGGGAEEVTGRARGTLGHPNFLGPFLLFVVPMFIALALTLRHRIWFLVALGIGIAGTICLVATRSRMPIAIMFVAILTTMAILVAMKRMSLTRVSGLMAVGAICIILAALPIAGKIYDRLTGDFSASVEFRVRYNAIALKIWAESPWLGLGLNNFQDQLARYEPGLARINAKMEKVLRKQVNLRTSAPVHNVYLLVLAETGIVGLAAFLFFYCGVIWRGIWAIRRTRGAIQVICIGLTVGLSVQLLQQMVDFSLWYDASIQTVALLWVLLAAAPATMRRSDDAERAGTLPIPLPR